MEIMQIRGDSDLPPTPPVTNSNPSLRSLLRTSGLFNRDMESSDDLSEFFANGEEFTLHRLLSDIGNNDFSIDMTELAKFESAKQLDVCSISDYLKSEVFESVDSSAASTIDTQSMQFDSIHPSAVAHSSDSFGEYYPPTPNLNAGEVCRIDAIELKSENGSLFTFTELNALEQLSFNTPSASTTTSPVFKFDPNTLIAFDHNYGFVPRPTALVDTPPLSSPISKRTPIRVPRRTSSRLQARAQIIPFNEILANESCLSPALSENSSISVRRSRRIPSVQRAADVKTEADWSYYLERRRKNNEASKISRAARKQKFDEMDLQCAKYEHDNAELQLKISTLENVVKNLKDGLAHILKRHNN